MEGIGIGLGILAIAVAFLLVVGAFAAIAARGKHAVVCPGDGRPATVRSSGGNGVAVVLGGAEPRIAKCDRWPDRAGCAQGCVAELKAPPTFEQVDAVLRRRRA